jgi:hypothetical protein
MRKQSTGRSALLASALAIGVLGTALADTPEPAPLPVHFTGVLSDYTTMSSSIGGSPYEIRGKWTLDVDPWRGTARFSAALVMETSDYGVVQGVANASDPGSRTPHTHHISMTVGKVTEQDWATSCPSFKIPVKGGFVVRGSAYVAGNGGAPPFAPVSPVTICVLGGDHVEFSNLTLVFGAPANGHFGTFPLHGVVTSCRGPWGHPSSACSVHD